MSTRIAWLVTSVVVASIACSKDDEMGEEEFCPEYARTECATVGTWCASSTPDACVSTRTAACQQRASAWKSASRPFNAGNARACIDKVKSVYGALPISPENLRALNETCSRVYQGVVPANGACTVDFDCQGGLICDKGVNLCGTKRVVAAGAGCANVGEVCPAGQTCKPSGQLKLCQARATAGMACSAADPCLESLRCTAASMCEARLAASSACTSDDDCASGYCDTFAGVCATFLIFAPDSASCRSYFGTSSTADGSAAL
jgi:hypothetical protein